MYLNDNYKKAVSQVNAVLENMEQEYIDRIPQKLKNMLKDITEEVGKIEIDTSKKIEELDLMTEAKDILAVLYYNYWSTPIEKIKFNKIVAENEQKYKKEMENKYNINDLFKEELTQEKAKKVEETAMILYGAEESFMKSLLKSLKEFFFPKRKKQIQEHQDEKLDKKGKSE